MTATNTYLALDVGTRRIGVALIDGGVSIARPLQTIEVDGNEFETITELYQQYQPSVVVIGYPRNQSGEATKQTALVEDFARQVQALAIPTTFQDESLTSVLAEQHLKATGQAYTKGDIDAVAAALILTDYIESH